MFIKLVIGECTLNFASAYAPQASLDEEVKRRFWESLDEVVHSIPPAERLFIGGDFKGHIRSVAGDYGEVHGGFGFGDRNGEGSSLLDFTKAFKLVIANSSFPKREEHLVTFRSSSLECGGVEAQAISSLLILKLKEHFIERGMSWKLGTK
ncbi:uncharacterized protein [Nicotiana sylvestris]|uniref:uncharacterized protein n=1 Tax=Nicotiana sylvestris TaxID=4096 RepID=UPI00388C62B4